MLPQRLNQQVPNLNPIPENIAENFPIINPIPVDMAQLCQIAPMMNAALIGIVTADDTLSRGLSFSLMFERGAFDGNTLQEARIYYAAARIYASYKISVIDGANISPRRAIIGALVESSARYAPDNCILSHADGMARMLDIATWLLTQAGANSVGVPDPVAAIAARQEAEGIDALPEIVIPGGGVNIDLARLIIRRFALLSLEDTPISPISYFAHVIIGYVKRGTVSERFIEKINNSVLANEPNRARLNEEIIRGYYRIAGPWLDIHAEALFNELAQMIPREANLRLNLTLTQAAGSGLTALRVIGSALRLYPRFQWDVIVGWFPQEFIRINEAMVAVGDNQYYGYRRNTDLIRSTRYKSVAWVCKEMLIQIDGRVSLRNYRGWPREIAHQGAIEAMIEAFRVIHQRHDAIVNDRLVELPEQPDNIRELYRIAGEQGEFYA